jgi:hypothetical protein
MNRDASHFRSPSPGGAAPARPNALIFSIRLGIQAAPMSLPRISNERNLPP